MPTRVVRAAAALAPGLLLAVPALPWVWDAWVRATEATLGRDQGIFQYVAWAVAGGARLHRDVRDVNGPVVVMMHRLFLALGGADERTFRTLDLVLTSGAAAFAGTSLTALDDTPRPREERVLRAAALGLAAWVLFLAQYLMYGSWDDAQRESFFDVFVCVAIGAQLRGRFALAGAASLVPWLGKPTYALFTLAQLLALVLERQDRRRRLSAFVAGGALGALVPFFFLVFEGDVGAWARVTFHDVPTMYRFIWPRTVWNVLTMWRDPVILAAASSGAALLFVLLRRLPTRALPIALLPALGLASAVIQRKGFPYHFHPATLGSALVLVTFAQLAWIAAERRRTIVLQAVALALPLTLGVRAMRWLREIPYPPAFAPEATLEERLAPYERVDFFPIGLRRAADELARTTKPTDTVQTYGMDPYVLFLARRRSATPYVFAYDLNADAALHGSFDEGGPTPDDAQRAAIRALRDAHERDLLARLLRDPPAAFVFLDRSPLLTLPDAEKDFELHCPDASAWVLLRYHEATNDEGIRVWLRNE